MFANRIESMPVGSKLLEAPVPLLIESLGKAIAKAQFELDATGVRIGSLLGETRVEMKNATGETVQKSLLDLGFTPTFYHFAETEIEVKMTISMQVEESLGGALDVNAGNREGEANQLPVAFGAALNIDYHTRFGFDQEGSSRVTTKLVARPAPAAFLDSLRDHAIGENASGAAPSAPVSPEDEEPPPPAPEPSPEDDGDAEE